ncbi:hypothetical protein PMAYCL1PPCAC_12014 [Pristionchus mayeri]|uniref:Lipid-binding serum glycoprotein C-terminal domain-containing protein n=1 Tax=Pristionchus mayeri TaxID=1317129 RepID=A0AAN4ZM47_9BILA|nr:hypothetical protein PMAYCL1PPCAC_12014 [Pristionchus mayeri]
MSSPPLLLLLLLIFSPFLSCTSSNLKTRLNKAGFNFLSKSARQVIDKEVPAIEIPDFKIDFDGGWLGVADLEIMKFQAPEFIYENIFFSFDLTLSPAGLHWDSTGGGLKIGADIAVKYGILYQEGWFVATAGDLRISLSATASTLDGRPQLAISDCNLAIQHFDLHIGGNFVMWLINLFRDILSYQVQLIINQQACSYARDLLLTQGNDFLHSLPIDVDIGKGFFLHYHIDDDPKFTSEHADLSTTVTVTYSNQTKCSYEITPLDAEEDPSSMGSIWVSDQIPNCLLETAFNNVNLSLTATHVNLPSIESYLKTSCWLSCIGFFFPSLKRNFPNQHVSLTFAAASPPVVSFLNGSTSVNASINLDFHIYPMESNPDVLLRLNLLSIGEVEPYLEDRKLKGKIDSLVINATEVFSTIGDVSQTFLTGFDTIFKTVSTSFLSVLLSKGIPLPIFDNLSISDTSLITERPGQVLLSLNFTDFN